MLGRRCDHGVNSIGELDRSRASNTKLWRMVLGQYAEGSRETPRLLMRLQFEQIANHGWIANESIFEVGSDRDSAESRRARASQRSRSVRIKATVADNRRIDPAKGRTLARHCRRLPTFTMFAPPRHVVLLASPADELLGGRARLA